METTTILACSASAIAGGTVTWAWLKYVWPNRHESYTWIFRLRPHHLVGRACPVDKELRRDGYALGYSFKLKSALWASFIVSEGSVGIDVERGDRFYADNDIPEKHRVSPSDYTNSGFDKGHLAPSAAIDFSKRSNEQTFAMSNIAPQDPELNRQAWGRLEGMIREWTKPKGKLAVVVGPTYGQTNKKAGELTIPKAFYMAIYSYEHKQCLGFLFPNKDTTASKIWDHAVSVKELEEKTELKFFTQMYFWNRPTDATKAKLNVSFWKKD